MKNYPTWEHICLDMVVAARPFAELAQELLNGHQTGRIAPEAPRMLLAAIGRAETALGLGQAISEPDFEEF